MLYVVVCGPAKVGKSLFVRYIGAELDRVWARTVAQDAFAAPIRHFVSTALGEKYASMNQDRYRAELQGRSVASFIQDMREHIAEEWGDDFLARMLVHRTLRLDPLPEVVIVECAEPFCNVEALKTLSGHIPYVFYLKKKGHEYPNPLTSEYVPIDPDMTLLNTDGKDNLLAWAEKYAEILDGMVDKVRQ